MEEPPFDELDAIMQTLALVIIFVAFYAVLKRLSITSLHDEKTDSGFLRNRHCYPAD